MQDTPKQSEGLRKAMGETIHKLNEVQALANRAEALHGMIPTDPRRKTNVG